jgi:hypothetical protein
LTQRLQCGKLHHTRNSIGGRRDRPLSALLSHSGTFRRTSLHEVIDAVEGLAAPEPFRVRLGIAGGLVVVGDLIGAGAAQERGLLAVVKLRTIEFRFAVDSPVERNGFERSVPR